MKVKLDIKIICICSLLTDPRIKVAIMLLKNNKAASPDGLPTELFKTGGHELVERMHQLIYKIWLEGSVLRPVFKKGDSRMFANYSGMSLLPIAYKVLIGVLCERLKPLVKTEIGLYQCGFRPGKSKIDQIFTILQILEMTPDSCSSVKIGMDLFKPFDTVRGFRQRDPFLCDLFNFVTESVLKFGSVQNYSPVASVR